MNWELPDVQAGFRKGRGTRDQIVNICWIIEKAREFQKNIYFWFIEYGLTKNCEKFLKRWEYQTTLPASWETPIQVRNQQLEPDMGQRTGSKSGKGVCPSCILSSCLCKVIDISPSILIPACASSSPAFHMMYSAYKLNKQGCNIQPWHTPSQFGTSPLFHVRFYCFWPGGR